MDAWTCRETVGKHKGFWTIFFCNHHSTSILASYFIPVQAVLARLLVAASNISFVWSSESDTLGRTGNQLPPVLVEEKTCRKHAKQAEKMQNMQNMQNMQKTCKKMNLCKQKKKRGVFRC